MDKKKCTKCGKLKPLTDFHKRRASKDGHYSQCKMCVSEYQIKHYRDKWEAFFGFEYGLIDTNYKLYQRKMNKFMKEHPEYFN